MRFASGDRAILDQKRVEIKRFPGAVRQRDSHGCPVGYINNLCIPVLIQASESLKAISLDAKRDEGKVGRIDVLSFRLGSRHLLDEAFGRKMVGGAAGQE